MNKGLISQLFIALLVATAVLAVPGGIFAAEIFKTVDENGNVVYTDQQPADGSPPMDLPEISVIETDFPEAGKVTVPAGQEATDETKALTPREMRKMYRDFRITSPAQEETFWGTANTVLVSWATSAPYEPDMSVRLYVDEMARDEPVNGSVSLTLDRGEHQVYAELRDGRNRRIITAETITFFVKQHSVNFNRPGRPGGGG